MMNPRRFTKPARKYWKFLLVVAILLQLFLMIKDLTRGPVALTADNSQETLAHGQVPSKKTNITFDCQKIAESEGSNCRSNFIYLQSGLHNRILPVFCLNSIEIFERTGFEIDRDKSEQQRGLHAVVLDKDEPTKIWKKSRYDTYSSDDEFVNFLLIEVRQGDIVLLASFDEISVSLSATAREVLSLYYGSQEAVNLKLRDQFVMVGQKGLATGYAHEKLARKRSSDDYPPEVAKISICPTFPLGPIKQLPPEAVIRSASKSFNLGVMTNCGLEHACMPGYSIPIYISTGVDNVAGPELCINSHLVFHPLIHLGTSGFNLAQYDPLSQQIIARDNFNIIRQDLNRLEIFLEQIPDEHLLFGVIHDDASKVVANLTDFGLEVTKNLRYRSVAFFVGQRGAKTAIEALAHSDSTTTFANPITFRGCVPIQVSGIRLLKDPITESKVQHRFCGADGPLFDSFCVGPNLDEKWLESSPLLNDLETKENNQELQEIPKNWPPVVVMAGSDILGLQRTLESLANQVPASPKPVFISVVASQMMGDFEDLKLLVTRYGLNLVTCNCSSFDLLYRFTFEQAALIAKQNSFESFIFLEPDVALSPDFLLATGSFNSAVSGAEDIAGVSGWNHNGFQHFESDRDEAFLTESALPSPCFAVKLKYAEEKLIPNFDQLRGKTRYQPWRGVMDKKPSLFAVIEQSRCFKTPPPSSSATVDANEYATLHNLHHKPRRTSLRVGGVSSVTVLSRFKTQQIYDDLIVARMSQSVGQIDSLQQMCEVCSMEQERNGDDEKVTIKERDGKRQAATVTFEQADASDWTQLDAAAKCCQLHAATVTVVSQREGDSKIEPGFGIYKSTFQFKTRQMDFILVSKLSPLYEKLLREKNENKII